MEVIEEEKNIFPYEGGKFGTPHEESTIDNGLDFMVAHFIEPSWPRNVSTAATQDRQKPVYDRDRALLFYQGALRADCKLAIYPNYNELAKTGRLTSGFKPKPSHIFIDLDAKDFGGDNDKLESGLAKTLRNINRQLNGAVPTVLWSGGGYHVHQPLDPDTVPVYEELPEFKRYKDPSVQFMRYAERVLTGGNCDHNHRISFSSCMSRLPGSRNSKYEGETAEVRVIQSWNGVRARPTQQFMLTDFLIYLVQADFDARERMCKLAQKRFKGVSIGNNTPITGMGIAWIDRLLQTPIPDWRKTAVALVIAPYLIAIKRVSYEQAYNTIMQWATRCAQLSSLRPNDRGFVDRVHISLSRALDRQSRPMRYATLVQDYAGMYETIKLQEEVGGGPQQL